jgi:hypothetical protein
LCIPAFRTPYFAPRAPPFSRFATASEVRHAIGERLEEEG